ncbi:STAS domain-containing protein [Actinomadura sp. DC4]|uniref:STAS domain-containing protein n=1 Tax=Actinomadura sp. DC4 TaxID=3055069 RepID=UPI0025B04204|nr:STAS domain-containing protein [Actinomadura sp. DC4]MDN3358632.1 STAS domain-containing protein [Actinomadura sp. DC4]
MDFHTDFTVTEDDIVIMTLRGSLDVATAPKLRDPIVHLIDEGYRRLVLQMGQVDFIDSIGLGVLVGVVRRLRPLQGALAAAAPSIQTRKVIEITQLSRVLPLYADTETALAALRRG